MDCQLTIFRDFLGIVLLFGWIISRIFYFSNPFQILAGTSGTKSTYACIKCNFLLNCLLQHFLFPFHYSGPEWLHKRGNCVAAPMQLCILCSQNPAFSVSNPPMIPMQVQMRPPLRKFNGANR